jgi:hypothetical protein
MGDVSGSATCNGKTSHLHYCRVHTTL